MLRQYELRERHFECVIRSKELEVLLSRARAAEQKQLAEGEKARADKQEEEVCTTLMIMLYQCSISWICLASTEPPPQEGLGGSTEWAD